MNINQLEKTAGPVGKSLAKVIVGAGDIAITHPVSTLAAVGGLAAIGYLLDRANKVRGMHQILNEAHKTRIMNQQSMLLNRIANNVEQKPERRPTPAQMPIIPPLR